MITLYKRERLSFGYEVSKTNIGNDYDNNSTYRVNIIGYVTRLVDVTENTQSIIDTATDNIIDKLKELNFKCNSKDITILDNINKMQVTGYTIYNEINNKFII